MHPRPPKRVTKRFEIRPLKEHAEGLEHVTAAPYEMRDAAARKMAPVTLPKVDPISGRAPVSPTQFRSGGGHFRKVAAMQMTVVIL
jgi:hypothetical protein